MRTCEAAVEVLRETGNPAVMWGDCGLLHLIAERAGLRAAPHVLIMERRVLGNLKRCHDGLVAGYTSSGRWPRVRIFWLPGNEPDAYRVVG